MHNFRNFQNLEQIINKIEILAKYKLENDTDLKMDTIKMKWLISKNVD